jgi:outer membrane protein assembly factor BamA
LTGISQALGQQPDNFKVFVTESDREKLNELNLLVLLEQNVRDTETLIQWMYRVYENGYLLANYETENVDSVSVEIHLELGERFEWATLTQGNLPDQLLSKTGYKPNFFNQKIVNFRKISRFFEKVIEYSENSGYPFAGIQLSALAVMNNQVSAEIDFDPGPYIVFDSLMMINKNEIKPGFLSAYLKIKPGSAYDQRKIDNIPDLVNPLPYLSLEDLPSLYFANEQCKVSLELKDQKASAFDGIIGFLPNQNEAGKLLVTGQVYLKLENLFRSGKRLELNWQRVNIQSQELDLAYDHPSLFRLPLDFGFAFNLYKQDTTFLTRKLNLNIFYNNNAKGRIGINYRREVSRLLETDTTGITERPIYADYNLNYYGLLYRYNSLDHIFFPTNGWEIGIDVDIGNKNIIKNAYIDDDFYSDIPDHGLQWMTKFRINKYFNLRPRNIFLTRLSGGYMDGDQLFLNDLFRLGGLNTIRGFNEMFFYASHYIIGTLEYRYLFENESQLVVFFDGSYLGFDINNDSYQDFPVGVGAGISISTGAGLLNVIYAVGKSNDQPFNIRYSKIHIGYTGRF